MKLLDRWAQRVVGSGMKMEEIVAGWRDMGEGTIGFSVPGDSRNKMTGSGCFHRCAARPLLNHS